MSDVGTVKLVLKVASSVGNSLTSPSDSSPPVAPLALITGRVRHTLYRPLLYCVRIRPGRSTHVRSEDKRAGQRYPKSAARSLLGER